MYKITKDRLMELKELEKKILYFYSDKELLNRALMHSSYVNEQKNYELRSNERLEFLGDSVLSLIISDYLFQTYKNFPEGELTKLRSLIVCESSLASVTRRLGLGEYLELGKGEEITGGRDRTSILADLFEAVLASIYIDGGFRNAKEFALGNLTHVINDAADGNLFWDYKTHLQEVLQKNSSANISYVVQNEEGPDHSKTFYVAVHNHDEFLGEGKGKSKKEAEQEAAKKALMALGEINER